MPALGRGVSLVYLTLALFLMLFVSPVMNFAMKQERGAGNWLFFLTAVGLAALASAVLFKMWRGRLRSFFEKEKTFYIAVILGGFILLAAQLVICYGGWFVTGWDMLHVAPSAEEIARGFPVSDAAYYDVSPNNLFLTGLQGLLGRFAALFGITGKSYPLAVFGSCVCVNLSVCLGAITCKKLAKNCLAGYVCLALGGVFLGLSPWVLVPYSDTYGMLCPTLALCLYVSMENRPLKWFLVALVCLVGAWIKPTTVILLVAIALVHGADWLFKDKGKKNDWKQAGKRSAAVLLALVLAWGVRAGVNSATGIVPDPEKAFGITHFFMVGMNRQSEGIWNQEDVNFSAAVPAAKERAAETLQETYRRIREMGAAGFADHMVRKTLNNYDDGTLSWAREGGFFKIVYGRIPSLKQFYNIGSTEDLAFRQIMQVLWLLILTGLVLGWLRRKPPLAECVLYITIFGLSLFLLIFECRGRYLILYMPYYVIGGVLGWRVLCQKILQTRRRRKLQ